MNSQTKCQKIFYMKISKYQIKNNLIIILLIITNICLGQPGEIDLSFNSEDTGYSLGILYASIRMAQ